MQQNANILIIDDEKIALRNLEHVMKKEGYSVVATQSGQNALRLLEEQSFDIVLYRPPHGESRRHADTEKMS